MNMMRFILDCLRPARARAASAARDIELEAQVKDTTDDIEIKGLQDEVHMEQETLQSTQALCRHTQESVEKLEERKTQLKEELKILYELQKQEKEVLRSLQEEQQELEQTLQQYDTDLCSAAEELLQLQRDVSYAKAHAESLSVRIAPLQDVYEEIVQVKKKLSELVASLVTGENAVTEEAHCVVLDQGFVGRMDDDDDEDDSECDHMDCERIMSEQGGQGVNYAEQNGTTEDLEKMQRSLENLKSSGSSSFTEITLTEVKEEDVMFRSATPQSDSSDMEKEDFEIIQHSQATNKQFDFFNPNPFTDGDVFGDDHYPEVDVTDQLPRDPFKGTDPFASDTLLVNMSEEDQCQDDATEDCLPENVHYPLQTTGKDYGTFNAPINLPLGADFEHSMENFDCCVSDVETNAKQEQNNDVVQPDLTNIDVSPEFNDECVHESGSSHSSTVFNSFDAESNMFAEDEEEEDRAPVHAGSIKRVNSLCGLQSIISGSYTGFPLSPCDPEPMPGISDIQKIFEHHIKTARNNNVNDKECCQSEPGNTEIVSLDHNVISPGEQLHDINSNTSSTIPSICASQPSDLDVYDYKYGDMFFFTVRLDPGSPELHGAVCPEPGEIKKEEPHDELPWKDNGESPEFNDEFESSSPEPEDTEQHSRIPEDSDQHSRIPEDSDQHSLIPAYTEQHRQIPEDSEQHSRIPEDSDQHSLIPAYTEQHRQIPEDSEQHSRIPEDSEQHSLIPAYTEQHRQIPEDSEQHSRIPEDSEQHSLIPAYTEQHRQIPEDSEHSRIPEDYEQHSQIPEDSDQHSRIPEDYEQHRQIPEDSEQHSRITEDYEQHSQIPEDSDQHSRIPEDYEQHRQIPEDSEQHSRIPEDSEQHSRIPEDYEQHRQIPEDSDKHSRIPEDYEQHSQIPEDSDQHSRITEDYEQHSQIPEDHNSPDKFEAEFATNTDLHIPRLIFEEFYDDPSVLDSEWGDQWKASPSEAEHLSDSSAEDEESSAPKSTVQDLFCLLSNTDASTAEQLHAHEQLTPESSSSQQQQEQSCSEGLSMSKFELQYFDPFSPIPTEPVECMSKIEEMNTVNFFCSEAPRLDSGYHEVGTPTPFSPELVDKTKCSIDLQGPGLITSRQSDSEIHVPDPFSPESVDTGIFDSETENCESSYMMMTKCELFSPQLVYTDLNNVEEKQTSVPCDMLSDHFSGSELDDCCPFGSCPSNEGSYAYSSEENVITGPIRDGSDDYGKSKPSSMSNDDNSSEVFHSGSVWTNSEMSFPNHEVFDPLKNAIFDFSATDVGSFAPNISQESEDVPQCNEKVMEIDYFCSELSKMVSSSSSDSVQQSVSEMLFGSDPNASSFYPWDFEKQQNSC